MRSHIEPSSSYLNSHQPETQHYGKMFPYPQNRKTARETCHILGHAKNVDKTLLKHREGLPETGLRVTRAMVQHRLMLAGVDGTWTIRPIRQTRCPSNMRQQKQPEMAYSSKGFATSLDNLACRVECLVQLRTWWLRVRGFRCRKNPRSSKPWMDPTRPPRHAVRSRGMAKANHFEPRRRRLSCSSILLAEDGGPVYALPTRMLLDEALVTLSLGLPLQYALTSFLHGPRIVAGFWHVWIRHLHPPTLYRSCETRDTMTFFGLRPSFAANLSRQLGRATSPLSSPSELIPGLPGEYRGEMAGFSRPS